MPQIAATDLFSLSIPVRIQLVDLICRVLYTVHGTRTYTAS